MLLAVQIAELALSGHPAQRLWHWEEQAIHEAGLTQALMLESRRCVGCSSLRNYFPGSLREHGRRHLLELQDWPALAGRELRRP